MRGGYSRAGSWRGGPRGRGFRGGFRGGNRSDFGNNWHNSDNTSHSGQTQKWSNQPWPKRDTPGPRLAESEIGVTKYMSEHEGFNGIIKSRYSDFQVSEINEKGEVAKLTDLTPPEPPHDDTAVDEDEDLLLSKYNVEILPMDTWNNINKLVVGAEDAEKVEIDVTTMAKGDRAKIHEAVKKAFGDAIVGSTVNADDKKTICFQKFKKGARIDNRVKWLWPGEYVYFIVHKENCDTMDVATRIADKLRMHMKPQTLGYAGTKDRRAKTSQWFSARRVHPKKLANAMRGMRDVAIGNYSFHKENLTLGMLNGNKFRIALRNVTAEDEVINTACQRLEERGFLNYYGLQRFGTRVDIPTFDIGRQLLLGNYKQAIDLILLEQAGPLAEALRQHRLGCPERAAACVPRRLAGTSEARLLQALAARPNDYLTALQRVPRNTRLLYLHSYQSLVWNKCVTERVKRYGLKPAVGDLVPLDVKEVKEIEEDDESDSEESQQANKEQEPNVEPEKPKPKPKPKEKQKVPTKTLTQEDLDSGQYTIFDVIMPLPGHNIDYPLNMLDYYNELLVTDGLTLLLKSKHKSYSMSGAYRHMCVRPRDVSWRCVRYSEPYADLLASDRDELEGRQITGILPDGKFKALLLTFTLPVSCYATMALRELLKVDTSSDKQAAQNNYHKRSLSESDDHAEKKAKRDAEEVELDMNKYVI